MSVQICSSGRLGSDRVGEAVVVAEYGIQEGVRVPDAEPEELVADLLLCRAVDATPRDEECLVGAVGGQHAVQLPHHA